MLGKRYLILDDGSSFAGEAFGDLSNATGELVVNTNLNNYQEALTDPSYHNQIITFVQPSIGNIGINICNLYSNQLDKHVYFCTGLVAF